MLRASHTNCHSCGTWTAAALSSTPVIVFYFVLQVNDAPSYNYVHCTASWQRMANGLQQKRAAMTQHRVWAVAVYKSTLIRAEMGGETIAMSPIYI